MPQLMPIYWIMSVMMSLLLLLILINFYDSIVVYMGMCDSKDNLVMNMFMW